MEGIGVTRRERLMAILRGEPVDRPGVNFYEVGGFKLDPADPDPYNIYNAPDWQPLLRLAEEETDIIRMRCPVMVKRPENNRDEFITREEWTEGESRFWRTTIKAGNRTLTSLSRRDAAINTTWELEHLFKSDEDVKAYLGLPDEIYAYDPDVTNLHEEETLVGDAGIVMVDAGDPLCSAAAMFSMQDYILCASTNPELFRALLDKLAVSMYATTERVAREFPGHLWRICGPEYASEPYLPPNLFREYVVDYDRPMVESIQKYGGFARIHSHGRLRNVLPHIADLGASALDPIEPPPQGDVTMEYVRREYGKQMALIGGIEISDIENMPPPEFEKMVARTIREGTQGEGRGFVLMPSSSPYGRTISETTMTNYTTMVRLVQELQA